MEIFLKGIKFEFKFVLDGYVNIEYLSATWYLIALNDQGRIQDFLKGCYRPQREGTVQTKKPWL